MRDNITFNNSFDSFAYLKLAFRLIEWFIYQFLIKYIKILQK